MAQVLNLELQALFPGDSEMARHMRAFDWSHTALGPPWHWPQHLRTAISICLASRFPMHIWWGPALNLFYNDASIAFLGPARHPVALGGSGKEAWPGIWDAIGAGVERVLAPVPDATTDVPLCFDREVVQGDEAVTFSFGPILDDGGEVGGLFCTCSESDGTLRAKDAFLSILGHELRNPLAPILTALRLMQLRGVGAIEKERRLIERQAHHLLRLVDDLLDVSRLAQGKIALHKERLGIADILAKAIESASPLFEERCHSLAVDMPGEDVMVDADPERLAQVIANLLTNAAKYSEPHGHIRIAASNVDGEAIVEVQDSGIGIAPEELQHVFDLFVQAPQALNRPRGGLGLGLCIVRNLMALHGGSVSARSEGAGKGSTFTIRMPEAAGKEDGEEKPDDNACGNGTAILIVDDNQDAAQALSELLRLYGYNTCIAFDGPEALKAVESFVPAVALLDVGLPGMDGYELAGRLRNLPHLHDTKLIALTGYGQPNDMQRSSDAGFHVHMVKPVDFERLGQVIQGLGNVA